MHYFILYDIYEIEFVLYFFPIIDQIIIISIMIITILARHTIEYLYKSGLRCVKYLNV